MNNYKFSFETLERLWHYFVNLLENNARILWNTLRKKEVSLKEYLEGLAEELCQPLREEKQIPTEVNGKRQGNCLRHYPKKHRFGYAFSTFLFEEVEYIFVNLF